MDMRFDDHCKDGILSDDDGFEEIMEILDCHEKGQEIMSITEDTSKSKRNKRKESPINDDLLVDGEIPMSDEEFMAIIERQLIEIEEEEEKMRNEEKGKKELAESSKDKSTRTFQTSGLQPDYIDPAFTSEHCNADEALREPLFCLGIRHDKRSESISSLDGLLKSDGLNIPYFLAKISETHNTRLRFNIVPTGLLHNLLSYLKDEKYSIRLLGESKNGLFCVKGIHIIDSEKGLKLNEKDLHQMGILSRKTDRHLLRDDAFQIILERVIRAGTLYSCTSDTDYTNAGKLLTARSDMETMFTICKDTYPKEIQQWATRSFQSLDSQQLGSDDKRHILKALSDVLNIDWSIQIPQVPDLDTVRKELDNRFLGLDSVKERILEIAAQIRHARSLPKWGILLYGPAGVGKTSIANAISDILGMRKAYIDFSTVEDSEGLTGSSRIYSNATPGLIINQLFEQRTANLVMVLNEIDKAAKDKRQPLNSLLPLLDGMGYMDTYLEVMVPTKGILFIATCNEIDCISKPILDRFYRIDIPAYTCEEKRLIFKDYVLPTALENAQLDTRKLAISPEATEVLMRDYAVEPSIRDLERYTKKLITHYLMIKEREQIQQIEYSKDDICNLLGLPNRIRRNFTSTPGLAFGSYMENGTPRVFFVQAIARKGSGKLKILSVTSTSQYEYCNVAYEYLRTTLPNLMKQLDIVLTISQPLSESPKNLVGFAVCAAILSAIKGEPFSTNTLFWGGCDLMGTLYSDENDLESLHEHIGDQFDTFYTPYGTMQQMQHPFCGIIELPSVNALILLTDISDTRKINE